MISAYSTAITLSVILGVLYALRLTRDDKKSLNKILVIILTGIIGARVLWCLLHVRLYNETGYLHVFFFWEGGYSLWGAIVSISLLTLIQGFRDSAYLNWFDSIMPSFPIVLFFIILLGGIFQSKGVGDVVHNDYFKRFPYAIHNEYNEWRWAVYIGEAILLLFIWFVVKRKKGERFAVFLLLFSTIEIIIESVRFDDYERILFVNVSQVFSVIMLILVNIWSIRQREARLPLTMFVLLLGIFLVEYLKVKSGYNYLLLFSALLVCTVLLGSFSWHNFSKASSIKENENSSKSKII